MPRAKRSATEGGGRVAPDYEPAPDIRRRKKRAAGARVPNRTYRRVPAGPKLSTKVRRGSVRLEPIGLPFASLHCQCTATH